MTLQLLFKQNDAVQYYDIRKLLGYDINGV